VNINNWPLAMTTALKSYASTMTVSPWKYSDYCVPGFVSIGGVVATISASNNQIWAVDPNKGVWNWNGNSWVPYPGLMTQIAVCPSGFIYAVDATDKFYTLENNQWKLLAGGLRTIACGNDVDILNALYGINSLGKIYKYVNGVWVQRVGTFASTIGSIAVGNGKVWVLGGPGTIFNKVGRTSNFVQVAGTLK
jgi:hypothetical protein